VLSFTLGAFLFRERNLRPKALALAVLLAGVAVLCLARSRA
jgi:multidrug transporter EmrE-like cation transporter